MPPSLRLAIGEVHVWCGHPSDLQSSDSSAARALLSADELARLERYHFERDRRVFLATRVLVRTVLSKYDSILPEAWNFTANAYGRPAIAGAPRWLRFNLSNAHDLVVCAIAREIEVGVDVECIERTTPIDIADRFFAPPEVEALRALPPAERPARFFDYWTLKESYIKARGVGLSLALNRFAFSLEAGRAPRITIDPALEDDGASWQFVQLRPTATHLVSLCARRVGGVDTTVSLRWQTLVPSTPATRTS